MQNADPPVAADWHDGWLRTARRLDSPNFNQRPEGCSIDLIVVHSISLPPGEFGGDAVQRLFTNTLDWQAHPYFRSIEGLKVSAHFFIRRDGEIWQFVSTLQRAWHAGLSHYRGRDQCNDDSVGIELEGLEGDAFEPAQYAQLAWLCQAISQQHPVAHVAGHEHVAPSRKRDPGARFDWNRLQRDTGWPSHFFPSV